MERERPKLLVESSLAETVAAVEDAAFFGHRPSAKEAQATLKWLAERQCLGNGYRGMMCAPTEIDRREGARVFTGETLGSGAQLLHILGEEAYRSYLVLARWTNAEDLEPARKTSGAVNGSLDRDYEGRYCCGPCSVSLWRALSAGGYEQREERLALGMHYLHTKRDGKGRWGSLPFHYTLLALIEIESIEARNEIRYAGQVCEQLLQRHATIVEPFATRRTAVLERALSR